jgi:hypothetical protein
MLVLIVRCKARFGKEGLSVPQLCVPSCHSVVFETVQVLKSVQELPTPQAFLLMTDRLLFYAWLPAKLHFHGSM